LFAEASIREVLVRALNEQRRIEAMTFPAAVIVNRIYNESEPSLPISMRVLEEIDKGSGYFMSKVGCCFALLVCFCWFIIEEFAPVSSVEANNDNLWRLALIALITVTAIGTLIWLQMITSRTYSAEAIVKRFSIETEVTVTEFSISPDGYFIYFQGVGGNEEKRQYVGWTMTRRVPGNRLLYDMREITIGSKLILGNQGPAYSGIIPVQYVRINADETSALVEEQPAASA